MTKASANALDAPVDHIVGVLDKHKAEDITTIALSTEAGFADYMIIASGQNPRHVRSLADKLRRDLKGRLQHPIEVEGMPQCNWVLLDVGDVIIHIFLPEVRAFYKLEKLWGSNATVTHVTHSTTGQPDQKTDLTQQAPL